MNLVLMFALRNWKVIGLVGIIVLGSWRLYAAGMAAEHARNQIAVLQARNEVLKLEADVQKRADAVSEKANAELSATAAAQELEIKQYEQELKSRPDSGCALPQSDIDRDARRMQR